MILKNQNVLFFSRSTQHGGTENVILQLCEVFTPLVNKIIVISANGFPIEKLESLGIKHYCIPDIEEKNPYTIYRVMRELERVVKVEYITVIHTHHRMAAFYVEVTGLYKYCKFINTSHNTFYNRRILTKSIYTKAHLIACGEMVKKNLEDFFGLKNVTVIHNAVKAFDGNTITDAELTKAKANGKFLIANVGRLSEQKGMEYYILAISAVKKIHPEAKFFIVGSGENEVKLKKLAKVNGADVIFMGYRADIQNLMSQVDLIVLSSLWEGLPLTPIEAFSVGKTIIATGVDGTLEIVKDEQNGLLVKPKDPEELAVKICWMIEHPDKRSAMEREAQKTFKEEFSFDILARSYIEYYERL